jgi:peptidoglycan/xylan/chitin deacetylase (PgdA/CDA1 family)
MMEGIFSISLDFELHWGVFDKKNREERKRCYENTLQVIPLMLDLFAQYGVHVTWATVGSLFATNREEWETLKPVLEPAYENKIYSAYEWVRRNGLDDEHRWAHFAPETITKIMSYPGQELGTHTFSHYYCLEKLQGQDAFSADLAAVQKAAMLFDTKTVSLVFPRNQFNPQHLEICYDNGIKAIRSNPADWFWSPVPDRGGNLVRKIFRTGDAYIPMASKRTTYPLASLTKIKGQPLQIPASRFLRPWHPRYKLANPLVLNRIYSELKSAAKKKECYHLWWHPENFGDYPEKNIDNLKKILACYSRCKQKYGMTSWNMGEFARHFELNS